MISTLAGSRYLQSCTMDALRSRCFLSYRPDPPDVGFHKIVVRVNVPAAAVYARPGYRIMAE